MSELTDLIPQTTDPVAALPLLGIAALVLWVRQDPHEDLCTIHGCVRRVKDRAVAIDGGVEEDDGGR